MSIIAKFYFTERLDSNYDFSGFLISDHNDGLTMNNLRDLNYIKFSKKDIENFKSFLVPTTISDTVKYKSEDLDREFDEIKIDYHLESVEDAKIFLDAVESFIRSLRMEVQFESTVNHFYKPTMIICFMSNSSDTYYAYYRNDTNYCPKNLIKKLNKNVLTKHKINLFCQFQPPIEFESDRVSLTVVYKANEYSDLEKIMLEMIDFMTDKEITIESRKIYTTMKHLKLYEDFIDSPMSRINTLLKKIEKHYRYLLSYGNLKNYQFTISQLYDNQGLYYWLKMEITSEKYKYHLYFMLDIENAQEQSIPQIFVKICQYDFNDKKIYQWNQNIKIEEVLSEDWMLNKLSDIESKTLDIPKSTKDVSKEIEQQMDDLDSTY